MNDTTLITIIGISLTFIIFLIKMIFKSKCVTIDCCCIKITRDIQQEIKEHEFNVNHNINDNENVELNINELIK